MIRGDRFTATVIMVRQAHTLEELSNIEARVKVEGIDDPCGVFKAAVETRRDILCGRERVNNALAKKQ